MKSFTLLNNWKCILILQIYKENKTKQKKTQQKKKQTLKINQKLFQDCYFKLSFATVCDDPGVFR